MNISRRKFFGMTAVAVAAAGFPQFVLPEKTIFLPPRFGWNPSALGKGYLRETEQYIINFDEMWWRYDAIGRDIWGKDHQFHVDAKVPSLDQARMLITDKFRADGLIALRPGQSIEFPLKLPMTPNVARYV